MTDQNRVWLSVLAGAAVGGLAGFLLFTDRGRRLRAEIKPCLEQLTDEVRSLQDVVQHVRDSANEGWRRMEHFIGEPGDQGPSWPGSGESRSH